MRRRGWTLTPLTERAGRRRVGLCRGHSRAIMIGGGGRNRRIRAGPYSALSSHQ